MARKDWKVAFKGVEASSTYNNVKTHDYIAVGHKQLGRFDNFKTEKYPFILNNRYEKWFSKRSAAMNYLRAYMRRN